MFLISKINRKVLQPFELNSKMNIDLKRMDMPVGGTGSPGASNSKDSAYPETFLETRALYQD